MLLKCSSQGKGCGNGCAVVVLELLPDSEAEKSCYEMCFGSINYPIFLVGLGLVLTRAVVWV